MVCLTGDSSTRPNDSRLETTALASIILSRISFFWASIFVHYIDCESKQAFILHTSYQFSHFHDRFPAKRRIVYEMKAMDQLASYVDSIIPICETPWKDIITIDL